MRLARETTWRGRLALVVPALACVAVARGDVLWLRDGRRVEVRARAEAEAVLVDLPAGEVRIPTRMIARHEAAPRVADDWPARRAAALDGSPDDRQAAIWWAIQHGLAVEAVALAKQAAARDADDPAAARLRRVVNSLEPPLPDPDLSSLERLLPRAARYARGPHTLVVHQHDAAEAARKVDLLERVLVTFYLEQAARGLPLPTPRERLVLLWFRDRAEYQARLKDEGAAAFLDTHGYFHPTRLVVLQCDERAFDREPPEAGGEVARLVRELTRTHRDLGTAAHEWVHLLSRVSGLVPRHEDWPLWLHEGFAMQYEAAAAGEWAGPGQPSPERRTDWGTRARPVPLPRLLDAARAPLGYDRDFYTAAWAWAYFLRSEHPDAWASLLHQGRSPAEGGLRRPAVVRARIEKGARKSLADLQREWVRFLQGVTATADGTQPPRRSAP